jgi:peptide/nickel transport system permease protein
MAGLAVLLLLCAMALLAPHLATHPYDDMHTEDRFHRPAAEYPLGTDHLGRDIWSRIVWGSRISLSVGFLSAALAVSAGTLVGAVAGYYGGWVDVVVSRAVETVIAIPLFFLLITIVAVVHRSVFDIVLIIGLSTWPRVVRIVRGEFLKLKARDFAEASRALGATDARIIWRQILPNAIAPVIVAATLLIGQAILTESALSFLGFGVPPPFPSWGSMVSSGKDYLRDSPWIALAPGAFIFITVISFNFVGDGLRDALDPKLKR